MNNDIDSSMTAISRKKPSLPLRKLLGRGLIDRDIDNKILDYGCGRGADVSYLIKNNFCVDGYDPHWKPIALEKDALYDCILCTYVLNVVTKEMEQEILAEIRGLLSVYGRAYLTVRRDIKKDGRTKRGLQRKVYLDLPKIFDYSDKFCTYILRNSDE